MYSIETTPRSGIPRGRPPLQSPRLIGQVRERLRYLHYSYRTEQTYVYWAKFFIHFHGLRHPRELGKPEVEAFLTMLANERKVAVATHRQALSALLFLYREVLGQELPWLQEIGRPTPKRRVPAVLTQGEVQHLFSVMEGEMALLARLLYGTGMRLTEGLSLRVKDVDFDRRAIVVREGKGAKDRVVMLPRSLEQALREQVRRSRALWESDRRAGRAGVHMPDALARKYPRAAGSWSWHWLFPSATLAIDPRSGIERRHHLFGERLARALRRAVAVAGSKSTSPPTPCVTASPPPAAVRHRHPHGAGAAGPQRREHHHDLHPRAQDRRRRHGQSARRAARTTLT